MPFSGMIVVAKHSHQRADADSSAEELHRRRICLVPHEPPSQWAANIKFASHTRLLNEETRHFSVRNVLNSDVDPRPVGGRHHRIGPDGAVPVGSGETEV